MKPKYIELFEDWEPEEDWVEPDPEDLKSSGVQPEWLKYIYDYIDRGCQGDLDLHRWRNEVTHLPEKLKRIGGSLELRNFTKLERLPTDLLIIGYLSMYICPMITTLPKGLSVIGNISISQCESLTSLSDRISTAGLTISYCPNFDFEIPNKLKINNTFTIGFYKNTPTCQIYTDRQITPGKIKEEIREKLGNVDDVNIYKYSSNK